MTKYVISGYIGFDNFGDEAICSVLTNHLQQLNAEKITVISLNPVKTSELYGVNSCGMLNFFKPIFESDILISGGGSLLQDVTSLKSLIYYLSVIVTALFLGKKVLIFAQGFTPFKTKIGKIFTRFVLKYCNRITVRDTFSQKFLYDLGISSDLVCDPVYALETPKNISHSGVGVQLRYFPNLTDEFLDALAEEIYKNFPNQEIKLFSLQDKSDLPVIEHFGEILTAKGSLIRVYKNLSITETINQISSLEFLIGMRFHSCLVAIKSGVKLLGINYDIKVKTLSEEIGFPIINMFGCETIKGIENLKNVNPNYYKLSNIQKKLDTDI